MILAGDKVYFKTRKDGLFEPRPESVVEELKKQQEVENRKKQRRDRLVAAILDKLKGTSTSDESIDADLEAELEMIADFAALGKSSETSGQALEILDEVSEQLEKQLGGRPEEESLRTSRAARLLLAF